MRRIILSVLCMAVWVNVAAAVTTRNTGARSAVTETATPAAAYNYNYMYPYMNNQMRAELNPGTSPSLNANPISVIARTEELAPRRRVVPRTAARSATTSTAVARSATAPVSGAGASVARAATGAAATPNAQKRRVVPRTNTTTVARSARNNGNVVNGQWVRGDASNAGRAASNIAGVSVGTAVSSTRCLADYTECMNGYCVRERTAYNRCYCSSKLAQIDAKYQPAIDSLIKQIIQLSGTNAWSQAEMNQYWEDKIGRYTGDNSWLNLDNALNIDWSDMESRVRGQQAFLTGHEYCVQHLRACSYMASNMRDAYRSEISRDCNAYESGLMKIKNAAESIVEAYSE